MEPADLFKYTQQFSAEFAAADTFADFAASLDSSNPGPGRMLQHIADKYPGAWELCFQTFKTHGFVSKALLCPAARKVRDVFESVSLFPYETGGGFRHESQYVRAGAVFLSQTRCPGFAYFGRLGATYEWASDHLTRGEAIRSVRGGSQWLTAAVPAESVVSAYGSKPGPDDWSLATIEAVQWADGRILLIARAANHFGERWLALLDAGETALSMLSDHERGEIAAEQERQNAAWGVEPPRWTITGEDRAHGALGVSEPFSDVVRASSVEEAHRRVRDKRSKTREHILIKSAVQEA